METLLLVGVAVGSALYVTKLVLFLLAVSPAPGLKHWIHRHAFAQLTLDAGFGYLGAHIIVMAGSSLTAMIAMVTFGFWSMCYIMTHVVINKSRRILHDFKLAI